MKSFASDLAEQPQAPALAADPRLQSWETFRGLALDATATSQIVLARLRDTLECGSFEDFALQIRELELSYSNLGMATRALVEIYTSKGCA